MNNRLMRAEEAYRIYRESYDSLDALTEDDLICIISEWLNTKIRKRAMQGYHSYTLRTGSFLSIEINIPTSSGILSLTLRDICITREISAEGLKQAALARLREADYKIKMKPDQTRRMLSGAYLTVVSWGN